MTPDEHTLAHEAIFTHGAVQKAPELVQLIRHLQGREIRSVLEIGSQNGGTLWLWSQLATDTAHLVAIDIGFADDCRAHRRTHQRTRMLTGDSHSPAMVMQTTGLALDLLFLDGDHTYEGVKRDFELYAGLVKPGGVVVFHDIIPFPLSQVNEFWETLPGVRHEFVWPQAVNVRGGAVLPAQSCGLGVWEKP